MAFHVIKEPYALDSIGLVPAECLITQAAYLGYGRNAWHSTWIKRYDPACISLSIDELKQAAERQRVQGSVFTLENIPLVVLRCNSNKLGCRNVGVAPINEAERSEYDLLFQRLLASSREKFWHSLPDSSSNWLMTFFLEVDVVPLHDFQPTLLKSQSLGVNRPLEWLSLNRTWPPKSLNFGYPRFMAFARQLFDHFKQSNERGDGS